MQETKLTLSVAEAARSLGVSKPTMLNLIHSDRGFPAITVGRRIIIPVDALNRWLNQQSHDGIRGN